MLVSRATRIRSGLLATSLAVAGLAVWNGYSYLQVQQPLSEVKLTQFINSFRTENKYLRHIKIQTNEFEEKAAELRDPNGVIPNPQRYDSKRLAKILSSGEACQLGSVEVKTPNERKLKQWFDYKCGHVTKLDPNMWRTPPKIHPLGGSWAYWLSKNGFGDLDWLYNERRHLHLLEYRHIPKNMLDDVDRFFADLGPIELQLFILGSQVIIGNEHVYIPPYRNPTHTPVHIFSRASWDRALKKLNIYHSYYLTADCDVVHQQQCWGYKNLKAAPNERSFFLWVAIALIVLVAALVLSVWTSIRTEQGMRDNQQLVMQTLAHELRHPVTNLKLSMNAVRGHFDTFSDDMKREFLRLTSTTERMTRLVNMSQQYLKLLSKEKEFAFRQEEIESFSDFMLSILDDFEGRVQYQTPSSDSKCVLDTYWAGTCIFNLINNAITHGRSPIVVSWTREGQSMTVEVQDSGPGPTVPFNVLVQPHIKTTEGQGLGLGLSLVNRLMNLMGGSFEYIGSPTRFTLKFRGVCRD